MDLTSHAWIVLIRLMASHLIHECLSYLLTLPSFHVCSEVYLTLTSMSCCPNIFFAVARRREFTGAAMVRLPGCGVALSITGPTTSWLSLIPYVSGPRERVTPSCCQFWFSRVGLLPDLCNCLSYQWDCVHWELCCQYEQAELAYCLTNATVSHINDYCVCCENVELLTCQNLSKLVQTVYVD